MAFVEDKHCADVIRERFKCLSKVLVIAINAISYTLKQDDCKSFFCFLLKRNNLISINHCAQMKVALQIQRQLQKRKSEVRISYPPYIEYQPSLPPPPSFLLDRLLVRTEAEKNLTLTGYREGKEKERKATSNLIDRFKQMIEVIIIGWGCKGVIIAKINKRWGVVEGNEHSRPEETWQAEMERNSLLLEIELLQMSFIRRCF